MREERTEQAEGVQTSAAIAERLGTEQLRVADNQFMHPWEELETYGQHERTVMARAEGIYLYDSEGNSLIDGPGGMWCVNVGHGRTEIADAVAAQIREMAYVSPWSLTHGPAGVLSRRLAEYSPGDLNNIFFTTCGSTAVDSALRFAMFYNNVLGRPEKKHIITRMDAYHGSTYLGASVSGKGRDKNWFDFETETIHFLPSPNPYRRPADQSVEEFCTEKVADLENRILEVGPERVAAFIAEPVLASGGLIIPPDDYHRRCQEVCRKHDVLYISDEVVTAFGRLGHMFASEDVFGITPDIITTAKGLTSGYVPMGAVLISDRILDQVRGENSHSAIFSNGFTYSGHPVSCAAALANMDIIENESLLAHVRDVGPYFLERLAELRDLPIVGDVRGKGLMGCVECFITHDAENLLELDYEIGNRIDAHCQKLGLLVRPIVNMCVMSPPLTITREEIDDLVAKLRLGIERAMQDLRDEGILDR